MKIYTKTGDKGETSLAMGGRVKKYDPRVELYGTCDELNSVIGIAVSFLDPQSELGSILLKIQSLLFELGSELAGFRQMDELGTFIPIIREEDIMELEQRMDDWQTVLEPLRQFVLPGGVESAAFLHQSRTVCRRLERRMVEERDRGLEIPDLSLVFINRLSDFLFLSARIANKEASREEPKWISRAKKKS